MKGILQVSGLCKSFQDAGQVRSVLKNLSFHVRSGQVIALTGPSGSGKSTLLNLLAGTLQVSSGSIALRVDEQELNFASLSVKQRTLIRRRHIGYVFQFFNLIPTLTVTENVLLPLELNGLMALQDEALARLQTLGLGGRENDFPDHLSGGERQRTAIARALAHRPMLVLADEPTGNLDARSAEVVADMLIDQVRILGSGMVMATHNEAIAARADHILRLAD